MNKNTKKGLSEEFNGGKCEDCGNFTDHLHLDDDGAFKCDSCMMMNDFDSLFPSSPARTSRREIDLLFLPRVRIFIACEVRTK